HSTAASPANRARARTAEFFVMTFFPSLAAAGVRVVCPVGRLFCATDRCGSGFTGTPPDTFVGFNVGCRRSRSSLGQNPPLHGDPVMKRFVILLALSALAGCTQKDAPPQAQTEPAPAAAAATPVAEPAGEPSKTAAHAADVPAGDYKVDKAHTTLIFRVSH